MKNVKKRIIAAITVVFYLILSVPAHVLSAPADDKRDDLKMYAVQCSENIYALDFEVSENGTLTRKYNEETDYILDVFGAESDRWSSSASSTDIAEGTSVSAQADSLTLDLSDSPLDISWYHELTMNLTARSSESEPMRAFLTVTTTENEYTADALIEPETDTLIAVPLDAVRDAERIAKLTLSVPGAEYISLSQIFSDNRTLVDFLAKYRAACFVSNEGDLSTEHGTVVFKPEAGTVSTVRVSSALIDELSPSESEYIELTITSTTSGDKFTLLSGTDGATVLGSVTLSSGTGKYYFPVSDGYSSDYALTFEPSSAVSLYQIDSAALFSYPLSAQFVGESLGKVTDVRIGSSPDRVIISGNISSASVVKYIGYKIAVYELPLNASPADEEALNPVETFDISTQLNISLPISEYSLCPERSAYAVAILTDGGPLFISEPKCAQARYFTESDSDSVVGIYGATTVGIFESNAAHAVFDIDFAQLTGGVSQNKTGVLCSYGKKYFRLDTEMLSALDDMIRFCASANVSVYLRLVCSEDLSSLGYTTSAAADGIYPFDLTNDDGVSFFAAVLSFLAERYQNTVGYIYGLPAAVPDTGESPHVYAQNYANVITTIRNTTARCSSTAVTYASFRSDSGGGTTPAMMCKMISYYLSANSSSPLGIAWAGESTDTYARFLSSLENLEIDIPDNAVMFLTAESGSDITSVSSDFAKNAKSASKLGLNVLFLCVPENLADSEIYDSISSSMNEFESSRYTFGGDFADAGTEYSGKVGIWDFSESYSASGWLAGDGCESVITELHHYFGAGKRSLEAAFTTPPGRTHSGGVILFKPDTSMRLSSADVFSTVLYGASSADTFEIKIIFGYGDTRYEYVKTAETNKPITINCDTKNISDSLVLNYIAIVVKSDAPLKLNISEASALSETMGDSEIRESVFGTDNTPDDSKQNDTSRNFTVALIVTAVAVSAIIFALLSRRRKKAE